MASKKKLLIVDDDAHVRRLIRLYLRNSPLEIHEAGSGDEALRVFEQHKFDAVILDIILPYAGGFQLCRTFKQNKKECPWIMIITGDDTPESQETATECGANEFLAKPFTPGQVIEKLRDAGFVN